ncbi:MAG: globin [Caulobacter sp.]|nr:globin [Caulobacter sp.]
MDNAIEESLQIFADRAGDPADLIYARLFAVRPDLEPLFVGDRTGAARGEMLSVVFETLMDMASGGEARRHMIAAEVVNHDQLGVPAEVFADFFDLVAAAVRETLGPDWTPAMAEAWGEMLGRTRSLSLAG